MLKPSLSFLVLILPFFLLNCLDPVEHDDPGSKPIYIGPGVTTPKEMIEIEIEANGTPFEKGDTLTVLLGSALTIKVTNKDEFSDNYNWKLNEEILEYSDTFIFNTNDPEFSTTDTYLIYVLADYLIEQGMISSYFYVKVE